MVEVGNADQVATQLERFYHECGGWGTLLLIAGKSWSTAEKRGRSMRLFMQEVAPRLRLLHNASAA